jgi:bacterioferritin-associated ferredoxin
MGSTLTIDRCVCRQTTFAELLPLARANGWDVPAIGAATGCGVQCGLCRPYLREMLMTGTTVFHSILTEPSTEGSGR